MHIRSNGAAWLAWAAGAATATILVVGCIDGPTGPGSHPPVMAAVSLTLPAATPSIWFPSGESLHVAVRRAGRADAIVDTTLVIADSLLAVVPVPMSQALENFVATAEVLYSGSVYFLGFEVLRLNAGIDTAVTLAATYVGPGARAASYTLGLRDSTLSRGDTTSLMPVVLDSASQPIENVPARYVSRQPTIVAVAPSGVVTAQPVPPDTGRIVGYLPSGLADSLVVRVASRVDSVAVIPVSATLTVGATQQFAAEAYDSAGTPIPGVAVTWSAAPPEVATVDGTGLATAVSPGAATITATADGISGAADLTVSSGITYATEDIVFVSTRDAQREVYVMNADGSGQRRLTVSPEEEFRPAWAPDRSAVVFERDVAGTRQLFRVDGGGAGEAQLTFDGENTRARFTPDGTRIGFTSTRNGRPEVWVMAADGTNQQLLEPATGMVDDPSAQFPVGNYFGDWSPDGEQYVFNRYDCPEGCWSELGLGSMAPGVDTVAPAFYLMGADAAVPYAVRWSPQGWRVAMTLIQPGDTALRSEGWPDRVMPAAGSTFRANAAFAGAWDRFVFESEDAGVHGIYSGTYGGAGLRLSPAGVAEFEPDHVPAGQPSWITSVRITGDTATPINPDAPRQLSGLAFDQDGRLRTPENAFGWFVGYDYPDYYVASVDTAGLVTGKAGGRARVRMGYGQNAYTGTFGDSATVTVVHQPGTWAPSGLLTESRTGHAGAVLADGRVLMSGGLTGFCGFSCAIVSSAIELFDPATETSTATGGMRAFRQDHSATTLPDGRVLIVGGRYGDFVRTVQRTAELYDPATGTTAYTDSVGKGAPNTCCYGIRYHTATLLADGKVLVAGGGGATSGNVSYAVNRAERYDPATGTFTPTGNLVYARQRHTATRLPDGRVLLAGGYGSSTQWGFRSAEIYDPATGTFSLADSLNAERREHAAVALADGRVLIVGGFNYSTNQAMASAEIYDPATGQFTPTGDMTTGRYWHAATLLPDGRVLISGGNPSSNTAELFDPASGTFTPTGSLSISRYSHFTANLPSGLVGVFGGTTIIELYKP